MSDRLAAALAELVAAIREEVAPPSAGDVPDRLLSIDEAAAALGIGRSALYDALGRGELRNLTIGRRRLIPAAAVAEYIAGRAA